MGRSFYIIVFLIGFLVGVLLYLVWQPSFWVLGISVLLSGCAMAYSYISAKCRNGCDSDITLSVFRVETRLIASLLLAVCFGLFRASLSEHRVTPEQIDFYNDSNQEFVGLIVGVDVRRDKAKYTIASQKLEIRNPNPEIRIPNFDINGDVLITLDKYPQFHYGDLVRVYGELQAPGEFDGFNYGNYLSRYGVYSVMYRPKITLIKSGQGNLLWRGMIFLQNQFMDRINRLFPEPYASFEAGLLVGARKGIPSDLMEKFNITGLTHIIAISGYNITIIIVFVMWILKGLPRRISFLVAIVSIVLFTLFVGASPAVVRASIMGVLGLIALNYGRQSNIHITILWTAFFMVLWNPKILWWDVGFQLSFAAVLGLIYVAPLFDRYFKKLPENFGIREAILMTISAQVMALPIIVYNFERLSLIAPLANLLVAFAIPFAMLFGFLAILFSFLFNGIALIFAYFTWGILCYIIQIIEWMSEVPYASVSISGMYLWMLFGYYFILILFFIFFRKRLLFFRS